MQPVFCGGFSEYAACLVLPRWYCWLGLWQELNAGDTFCWRPRWEVKVEFRKVALAQDSFHFVTGCLGPIGLCRPESTGSEKWHWRWLWLSISSSHNHPVAYKIFKIIFSHFWNNLCVSAHAHLSVCVPHSYRYPAWPKEGVKPPETGVQVIVSCRPWVLGTKLKSSWRAVSILITEPSFHTLV